MKRKLFIIFLIMFFVASFPTKEAFAVITWISTPPLPPAYVGVPYSFQLQATGEVPPVTYAILPVAGSLPLGLNLSVSGLISGTVTSVGTSTFTVNATANTIAGGPETLGRIFTISSLATGVTGSLRIKRLQIHFDNNRPEITVAQNQSPPRVFADISFIGSGILRGYWSVDGAIHSRIQQTLISGRELVLALPAVPPLPTYQTGGHRIKLVITEPLLGMTPEAIYYVNAKEKRAFAPIGIISPANMTTVDFSFLTFSWQLQKNTTAYLVEFLESKEGEPIFAAYTREASYTLPAHSLRRFFSEKKTYLWRVQGISENDDITNESAIHRFTFK